jgi:4,5-DOPA dioxygenase extradiol
MTGTPLPSLFVSHGPPSMVLDDIPVRAALARLGRELPRPQAILCVSAHWLAERPTVSLAERPETIHDFFGFDRALYDLSYPAPGAPELARRTAALLTEAGLGCEQAPERGLDHGAWEPLMLMYPEADVPVVQLSLQMGADSAAHLALGRALAPLRAEGVLVLASGTATHNLDQWRADPERTPDWAVAFDAWLAGAVAERDTAAIVNYRTEAPGAALAHPSEDHYLPLPVALGAGGADGKTAVLHRSFSYGSLSMAIFAFGVAE